MSYRRFALKNTLRWCSSGVQHLTGRHLRGPCAGKRATGERSWRHSCAKGGRRLRQVCIGDATKMLSSRGDCEIIERLSVIRTEPLPWPPGEATQDMSPVGKVLRSPTISAGITKERRRLPDISLSSFHPRFPPRPGQVWSLQSCVFATERFRLLKHYCVRVVILGNTFPNGSP